MKILYFSAKWCKPCEAFKPIVQSLCPNVEVVDVEDNIEIADAYHIKSVPALAIVDDDGNVVRNLFGRVSTEVLQNFLSIAN